MHSSIMKMGLLMNKSIFVLMLVSVLAIAMITSTVATSDVFV